MKSLYVAAAFLAYISFASTNPTPVLTERDGPADPAGSVLPTPAELPSYAPTASLSPATLSSKFQWQIYKSCPDANRAAINQAWADSKEMSDALASYKLKADFQPAMDMYMGDRSTYQNYLRDPPWDFPLQISSGSNFQASTELRYTDSFRKGQSVSIKGCMRASQKQGMPISGSTATKTVFGSATAQREIIRRQPSLPTNERTTSSTTGILPFAHNFTILLGKYPSRL